MDRFVTTHTSPEFEGPGLGELTMGYYTRPDLEFWYALADAFTICDNYHCSVMGPTHPNRLHALSGTLDPGGEAGGPVIVTNSAALGFIGSASLAHDARELEEARSVSWGRCYNPPGALYQPSTGLSMAASDNILLYFHQHVSDPSSPTCTKRRSAPDLPRRLPARRGGRHVAVGLVDHPAPRVRRASTVAPGRRAVVRPPGSPVALVSNPAVWSKTVLFIMYDENDGFFDHVAPPTPAAGTAGEYLTVDQLSADAGGTRGPIGFGFRVPMLVVSPFSRGGYVCSDVFDHTSQMRFLEARFGVQAPNISPWRRAAAGDLTTTLSGTAPDLSVPALPATDARGPVVTNECTAVQLIEIDVAHPTPYPVPLPQQMLFCSGGGPG